MSAVRRHRIICALISALVVFASGSVTASLVLGMHDRRVPVAGPTRTILVHDGAVSTAPSAPAPWTPAPSTSSTSMSVSAAATQQGQPKPAPSLATKPVRATQAPGHKPDPSTGPLQSLSSSPTAPPAGTFTNEAATADRLVNAWKNNDRDAASAVATGDVIDGLFANAWSENNRPLGCSRDVSGVVVCSYAEGTGTLGLYVAPTDSGYQVQGISKSDPG